MLRSLTIASVGLWLTVSVVSAQHSLLTPPGGPSGPTMPVAEALDGSLFAPAGAVDGPHLSPEAVDAFTMLPTDAPTVFSGAPDPVGLDSDCGVELPTACVDWSDCFSLTCTFDALIVTRTGLEASDFVFDGMGTPVLNSADIDMGTQAGPRASFLLGGRYTGLELTFFGFNQHGETSRVRAPGVTPVFFNGIPADPVSAYDIHSRARLYNGELNFWTAPCPRLRLGAGLRGAQLDEVFDVIFVGSDGSGFFADTDNDLLGGQIMAGVNVLRWGRLAVDLTAKWGVYNNDVKLDVVTESAEIHQTTSTTSYLTEINLGCEYFFARHLSLRAGYVGYWFEDLGLAFDQSNDFDLGTRSGTFDFSDPVYQGGYFGLQVRW